MGAGKSICEGSELHNHPPSQEIRVHAAHRQCSLIAAQMERESLQTFVQAQATVSIPTASIYASQMVLAFDCCIIPKDIANAGAVARRSDLKSRTVMEMVFAMLESRGFC